MNQKQKIMHLITRLDPGGSAENTVLSTELVNPDKFNSIVYTGPGLDRKGVSNEYVDRIGNRLTVLPNLLRPIRPHIDIFALFKLMTVLRKEKPDVLHLHSAKSGVIGRVAARLSFSKAKVIYTPHGHVFSGYGGDSANRLFAWIERTLAKWCEAIVGLTYDEIREFKAHNAGVDSQYCIIPSGVVLDEYLEKDENRDLFRKSLGFGRDDKVVGFIGRFEEVKGPDRFIEVANLLKKKDKNLRFLMVGDGSMKDQLIEKVMAYGLTDSITFTGWRKDIPQLMKAMDVFVLTSRNEGQGRVLVEAMACELPIVAMKSGGVSEVVEEGITGLLTTSGDIEATSYATSRLLTNPDRAEAMGEHGKVRAMEYFSVDVMIKRLEQLYSGLIENRKPSEILPIKN